MYDAYGRQTVLANNGVVAYKPSDYGQFVGFTGRYHDWETGLEYFRARYFDLALGRFIGRDPAGYVDGMGLYSAYFIPHNLDPSGMAILSPGSPEHSLYLVEIANIIRAWIEKIGKDIKESGGDCLWDNLLKTATTKLAAISLDSIKKSTFYTSPDYLTFSKTGAIGGSAGENFQKHNDHIYIPPSGLNDDIIHEGLHYSGVFSAPGHEEHLLTEWMGLGGGTGTEFPFIDQATSSRAIYQPYVGGSYDMTDRAHKGQKQRHYMTNFADSEFSSDAALNARILLAAIPGNILDAIGLTRENINKALDKCYCLTEEEKKAIADQVYVPFKPK
jgi:RHS repeat-associated protein